MLIGRMIGCPLAVAAVLSCKVQADRSVAPHLTVRTLFDCCRCECWVAQPVPRTLLWPASWLPAIDQERRSKSVEVQRVWEVYDERLQFMSRQDALLLDESLDAGDVSRAWLVWSGAAEAALADAYQFSGGPLPGRGLVLGRESASFRVVRLGGPLVRSVRGNVADAVDGPDVFLYRDSSIAPLLVMRRRFKAVMDVLGAMIRDGVSLARSVELTLQWERILAVGPLCILSPCKIFLQFGCLGLGDCHRLSDFIHQVVVYRRDEAIRGWPIGFGRTLWFIPFSGSGLTWFLRLPSYSVSLILRLVVLGC